MAELPSFSSLSAEDRKLLESQLRDLKASLVKDQQTMQAQKAQIASLETQLGSVISGLKKIRSQILMESAANSDVCFRQEVKQQLLSLKQGYIAIKESSKKGAASSAGSGPVKSESPLSSQSQYMAACRELESNLDSESRLFSDEFAASFAGDFGRYFISSFAKDLKVTPNYLSTFVSFLTRYIDDAIVKALCSNPSLRQVVILGSQGDSRAYRLSGMPDGVTFFNVDSAAVLSYRQGIFAGAKCLASNSVDVSSDPSEDSWVAALQASSFDGTQPAVFVTEGKLAYMSQARIEAQLKLLESVAAPGSVVIGDMPNEKNVSLEALHVVWDKYAEPVQTGCNLPEKLFEQFGFGCDNIEILGAGVTNYNDRAPPHFGKHMASADRSATDPVPRILVFSMLKK